MREGRSRCEAKRQERRTGIAPRLADGEIRVRLYGRLAPHIKHGLRTIAAHESRSMSWVVEEVLIDYFHLRRPRYRRRQRR
jgi:hypothetical protein